MSQIYKTCEFFSNMLLTITMSLLVSCCFSLPFPIVQWWYQIYRTCGWIIPLTYRCGAKISTGIFFGCDLVSWLMQVGLASDRGEAVVYGDRLLRGGVLQHITNELEFRDEYLYYRFIPRKTPAEGRWAGQAGTALVVGVCVTTSSAFTTEIGNISQRTLLFSLVKLRDVVLFVSILKKMVESYI